jgi:hypothetical protein
MTIVKRNIAIAFTLIFLTTFFTAACARRAAAPGPSPQKAVVKVLPRLGYAIQAGAFSDVENAARLTESLRRRGLNATYFAARTDLYKVRFGNFPHRDAARKRAEALRSEGVIEEFYIVRPEDYAVYKKQTLGADYLRDEIIKTAQSFIGLPYLWGGASSDRGFDCSGLAMAVYEINGLGLPRSSAEQHEYGLSVERDDLQKGDLVFFSSAASGKINHVGIYAGDDLFIHSPGRGRQIRYDALSQPYFRSTYRGARSYL